jgi:hypothetical protein
LKVGLTRLPQVRRNWPALRRLLTSAPGWVVMTTFLQTVEGYPMTSGHAEGNIST